MRNPKIPFLNLAEVVRHLSVGECFSVEVFGIAADAWGHVVTYNQQTAETNYRIYSRISRKIYDKIMPQKIGGRLICGSQNKDIFSRCQNMQFPMY